MNDITADQVHIGDKVNVFAKPSDKHPFCVSTITIKHNDDRGRPWVKCMGIEDFMPLFHIKPVTPYTPEERQQLTDGRGLPQPVTIDLIKGLDY